MQRPTWVTVVGILMILVAGCGGVSSDLKQIKTSALLEFQEDLVDELQAEFGEEYIDSSERKILIEMGDVDSTILKSDTLSSENLAKTIKDMTEMSPEAIATVTKHGYIGIIISILYVLTGFLLLFLRKKYVIKLVIGMLLISLAFVIYQALEIKALDISKLISFGLQTNIYFGAIIDVILLILLLTLDKSYFYEKDELGDYYDEPEATL